MDNDDEQYGSLVNRQTKNYKKYDTARNYASFSIGSTVVVQQKDGGPLTHDTVFGGGNHNYSNKSYMMLLIKLAT